MALPPLTAALPELSLRPPPPPPPPPPGPTVLPPVHQVLGLAPPVPGTRAYADGPAARRLPAIHEIGLGLRVRDGRVSKPLPYRPDPRRRVYSPDATPPPPSSEAPPAPPRPEERREGSPAPPAGAPTPTTAPPPPPGPEPGPARRKDLSRLKKELERKRCHQEQTRKSRRKMNDRIERIRKELPPPPPGIEVRHKAQILEYCINVLKGDKKEASILRERIDILRDENRMLKRQLEALKWHPAR